jgi:hypothetical protein
MRQRADVYFYAFDLLALDGVDLRGEPRVERKRQLRKLIAPHCRRLLYLSYVEGTGNDLFRLACGQDPEGIVAKPKAGTSSSMTRCRIGLGRGHVAHIPRRSISSRVRFATPEELRPSANLSEPRVQVRVPQVLPIPHLSEEVQVRLRLTRVDDDVTFGRMKDWFGHDSEDSK